MSGEQNAPLPTPPRRAGSSVALAKLAGVVDDGAASLVWRLVDAGAAPVRWLLDRSRARRRRRARLAPVQMIDRSVLLRLGAGGPR
ncbi:MAG: hypothetical protein KIT31_41535 [Deltaproteobacteria bacterium]|nr:hypothetical protein [Deltaproteobacteria bacterium]